LVKINVKRGDEFLGWWCDWDNWYIIYYILIFYFPLIKSKYTYKRMIFFAVLAAAEMLYY
jgi:hypothetical protein